MSSSIGYKWVQTSAYSSIPPNAVIGGNDEDGAMIYVGRAEHDGDMHVCKVVPSKQIGFISNRGEAFPKDIFEVLCSENLVWVKCYNHIIPENAVLCGRTTLDQPVYIGRGHYDGHLIIGKISSVHRTLFIAYRGAERRLDSYEILVEEQLASVGSAGWHIPPKEEEVEKCFPPPSPSPPPPIDEKSFPYPYPPAMAMPMPRPFPQDDRPPPMYTPYPQPVAPPQPIIVVATPPLLATAPPHGVTAAFTPAETYKPPLEPYGPSYPTYTPAEYAPPGYGCPPPPPPPPPHGEGYDMWVHASAGYVHPDAVIAGHDTDMSQLLVARAFHDGIQTPGKGVPSRNCAYVPDAGREIMKYTYQVLLNQRKYHWVPAYNGSVAPGAVIAGRSRNGEALYIGRAHHYGSLTPGKVHPSHGCLYIPFGGAEHRCTNYEVLVRSETFYRQQNINLTY